MKGENKEKCINEVTFLTTSISEEAPHRLPQFIHGDISTLGGNRFPHTKRGWYLY
jgi:hypothetical protein